MNLLREKETPVLKRFGRTPEYHTETIVRTKIGKSRRGGGDVNKERLSATSQGEKDESFSGGEAALLKD